MRNSEAHERRVALSVTTVGVLAATLNSSILLISLPAIFRGLGLDPLAPENISYLLWMLMGFLLVSAVLVVALGRLGDMYGRVKLYNLGFVIFTVASIALSVDPFHGPSGALWLIAWRVVQSALFLLFLLLLPFNWQPGLDFAHRHARQMKTFRRDVAAGSRRTPAARSSSARYRRQTASSTRPTCPARSPRATRRPVPYSRSCRSGRRVGAGSRSPAGRSSPLRARRDRAATSSPTGRPGEPRPRGSPGQIADAKAPHASSA